MEDEFKEEFKGSERAALRKLLRTIDLGDQTIDAEFVRDAKILVQRDKSWKLIGDFLKGWLPWLILVVGTVFTFLRPSISTWLSGGAS